MVSEAGLIIAQLEKVGVIVHPFDRLDAPAQFDETTILFGSAMGGPLEDEVAVIKVTTEVCRFTLWNSIPGGLADNAEFLLEMLELNLALPMGRIGMAVAEAAGEQTERFMLVQTMLFWRSLTIGNDFFAREVSNRLTDLITLYDRARELVSKFSTGTISGNIPVLPTTHV